MHPIYYALMVLAGGLAAYFVYEDNSSNRNSVPQRKNASQYPTSSSTRKRAQESEGQCCPICLANVYSAAYEFFDCFHPIHTKCMQEYVGAVGTNAPCPLCRTGRRVPQ